MGITPKSTHSPYHVNINPDICCGNKNKVYLENENIWREELNEAANCLRVILTTSAFASNFISNLNFSDQSLPCLSLELSNTLNVGQLALVQGVPEYCSSEKF
jgi:hypothetical protein